MLIKLIPKDKIYPIIELNEEDFVSIGRDSKNDIMITNPYVSTQHIILERKVKNGNIEIFIFDTNSSNGTYIDDKIIPSGVKIKLELGQKLILGTGEVEYILTKENKKSINKKMTLKELIEIHGIKEINKKTFISVDNLKKLEKEDFKAFHQAKLSGIFKVLNREYGIDITVFNDRLEKDKKINNPTLKEKILQPFQKYGKTDKYIFDLIHDYQTDNKRGIMIFLEIFIILAFSIFYYKDMLLISSIDMRHYFSSFDSYIIMLDLVFIPVLLFYLSPISVRFPTFISFIIIFIFLWLFSISTFLEEIQMPQYYYLHDYSFIIKCFIIFLFNLILLLTFTILLLLYRKSELFFILFFYFFIFLFLYFMSIIEKSNEIIFILSIILTIIVSITLYSNIVDNEEIQNTENLTQKIEYDKEQNRIKLITNDIKGRKNSSENISYNITINKERLIFGLTFGPLITWFMTSQLIKESSILGWFSVIVLFIFSLLFILIFIRKIFFKQGMKILITEVSIILPKNIFSKKYIEINFSDITILTLHSRNGIKSLQIDYSNKKISIPEIYFASNILFEIVLELMNRTNLEVNINEESYSSIDVL